MERRGEERTGEGVEVSASTCLLGLALMDLSCVALGNPFPSCIFIGHSAFKAMIQLRSLVFIKMH